MLLPFTEKLVEITTLAVLQRQGYLLDILEKKELVDALFLKLATKKLEAFQYFDEE